MEDTEFDNIAIQLPEYPEEVKAMFKRTSDFVRGLPLSSELNDELISHMAENVHVARKNGFICGLCMGIGDDVAPMDEKCLN